MKMVKSLLLGSAAGLAALTGAQAADLPVKAKPVEYVKICSLYGAGFYYIPGTDTCIRIGGHIRAEVSFNSRGTGIPDAGTYGDGNATQDPRSGLLLHPFPRVHQRRHAHADGVRHVAHLLGGSRRDQHGPSAWRQRRARSASTPASSSGVASRSAAPARRTSTIRGQYAFKWGRTAGWQSGHGGRSLRCGLHASVRQRHLRHAVAGRQQGAQARHL